MTLQDSTILVTGGTGSFGKAFVREVLAHCSPKKVIVYSRDELKQHDMRESGLNDERLRYFLGDVRDVDRLRRAMRGVDVVVHAAALKQVPACEYNPCEAAKTNIGGAMAVIEAAIDCGVKKVIALSTDKAVNPVNLYGATKLVAEKLFTQANAYSPYKTLFSCTRYGNVAGSRGSVLEVWQKQIEQGMCELTITDERMTRFWLTLEQGVAFVLHCVELMRGGEVFVPKLPSVRIKDLARREWPHYRYKEIGIRPGEKLHETLVSVDEARRTIEVDGMFIINPSCPWYKDRTSDGLGKKLPEGFAYTSDKNDQWLAGREAMRPNQGGEA